LAELFGLGPFSPYNSVNRLSHIEAKQDK
jgi:hypothetical protein